MKKILFVCLLLLLALLAGCEEATTSDEDTIPMVEVPMWQSLPILRADIMVQEEFDAMQELNHAIENKTGVKMKLTTDWVNRGESVPVGTAEILLGVTNRPESIAAKEKLTAADTDDNLRYLVEYTNGRIVLLADSAEAYPYLVEYFTNHCLSEDKLQMPAEGYIGMVTMEQYTADSLEADRLAAEAAERERLQKMEEKLTKLKQEITTYTTADFGTITPLVSTFEKPKVYPVSGQHPRVLFTESRMENIRDNIEAEENKYAYESYLKESETEHTGALIPLSGTKTHNVDNKVLGIIRAKAFRYALTGEEVYGYDALCMLKTFFSTLQYSNPTKDSSIGYWFHRSCGDIMYYTACVYDWCYDLMTGDDMEQLVAAIETKVAPFMEIGFPPNAQGVLTGHGSGDILLKDWFAFAIATYDEYPDIYEYVAGRMFESSQEAHNFYLRGGAHTQGSSYGPGRYYGLVTCEALFSAMTDGKQRFFVPELTDAATTFVQWIRPDGEPIRNGDDWSELNKEYAMSVTYTVAFYAAMLADDPILKGFAREGMKDFSSFTVSNNELSNVTFLALNKPTLPCGSVKDLPLVHHNGSPLGSITARSSRDEDAAMVYMKIGEAYSANHEHKDAGSFQIYYKGILASKSGAYDGYGAKHDVSYTKQTISTNSLLIFNPNMKDNGRWVYSGGQRISGNANNENPTLEKWLESSTSHQAKVIGDDYLEDDNGYHWAYLAGDLTNAYDPETVDEVSRYMMSVMTGDEANPMAFVVYDRITSDNAAYKKTFLLHMQEKPAVGEKSATITATEDGASGKLHVQSVVYDVEYSALGGEGQEFMVNGVNIPIDPNASEMKARSNLTVDDMVLEAGWGRVEITPAVPDKTNRMLTVMYVTDATNTAAMTEAKGITSEKLVGTSIFSKAMLFPVDAEQLTDEIIYTTEEALDHHVAGLAAGKWTVSVNGESIGTYTVKENGLLTFTAEAGTMTLTKTN